jgi:hypothetical protein
LVTTLNGFIIKIKGDKIFVTGSEEYEKYRKFLLGYIIVLNIPWIVMGIGVIGGWMSTMFDVFGDIRNNIFVMTWWILTLIMTGIIAYWILFKRGGEFIALFSEKIGRGPDKVYFYKIFVIGSMIMNIGFFLWLYIKGPIVPQTLFKAIIRGG